MDQASLERSDTKPIQLESPSSSLSAETVRFVGESISLNSSDISSSQTPPCKNSFEPNSTACEQNERFNSHQDNAVDTANDGNQKQKFVGVGASPVGDDLYHTIETQSEALENSAPSYGEAALPRELYTRNDSFTDVRATVIWPGRTAFSEGALPKNQHGKNSGPSSRKIRSFSARKAESLSRDISPTDGRIIEIDINGLSPIRCSPIQKDEPPQSPLGSQNPSTHIHSGEPSNHIPRPQVAERYVDEIELAYSRAVPFRTVTYDEEFDRLDQPDTPQEVPQPQRRVRFTTTHLPPRDYRNALKPFTRTLKRLKDDGKATVVGDSMFLPGILPTYLAPKKPALPRRNFLFNDAASLRKLEELAAKRKALIQEQYPTPPGKQSFRELIDKETALKWHLDCPFDNIVHDLPDENNITESFNACRCFLFSHGIKITSKEVTHGEGMAFLIDSDENCLICYQPVGYAGSATITHTIFKTQNVSPTESEDPPGSSSDGGTKQKYNYCGLIFHLDCAADWVRTRSKDSNGNVGCPACKEVWPMKFVDKYSAAMAVETVFNATSAVLKACKL